MTAPGSPVPVWLPPAVALAHWTQQARTQDAHAQRQLRRLATNAAWLVTHSQPTGSHGLYGVIEVGAVPDAPSDSDVTTWARAAWERAIAEGARAESMLAGRARRMLSEGERALRDIRRALDREVDAATAGALRTMEASLTAILRPVSRGIATAIAPVAGPAVLIGVVLLALAAGSRR